ncbi:MAG: hypothetical protein PHO01_04730 [Desulfotomaculaceae bacterium]|nr:hypothetical protein [Desulfotomaculaceae bacterium]
MEKKQPQSIRNQRRPKGLISPFTVNYFHIKNPWVTAWWSAAFPGYGFIILGSYVKGFLLVGWELFINISCKLNTAIVYSLTGRFEQAKEVIDLNFFLFYVAVYIMSIWRTYGLTVDLNKLSILADQEDSSFAPVKLSALEICYLDKKNPWMAAALSALAPGLGHLYTHRIPTFFFLLVKFVIVAYFAHLLPAIHYTAVGAFEHAVALLDPQWLLFFPSLYGFAIYDAYMNTVEYNKLFDMEQSRFIKDNYQSKNLYQSLECEFGRCLS